MLLQRGRQPFGDESRKQALLPTVLKDPADSLDQLEVFRFIGGEPFVGHHTPQHVDDRDVEVVAE